MAGKGFPSLPTSFELGPSALRQIAIVVNGILGGKQNNVTTVRLLNGTTTTTIQHPLIGVDSHLSLVPLTANASAIWASAWPSTRGKQTAIFTHSNTANADQTFSLEITG